MGDHDKLPERDALGTTAAAIERTAVEGDVMAGQERSSLDRDRAEYFELLRHLTEVHGLEKPDRDAGGSTRAHLDALHDLCKCPWRPGR